MEFLLGMMIGWLAGMATCFGIMAIFAEGYDQGRDEK